MQRFSLVQLDWVAVGPGRRWLGFVLFAAVWAAALLAARPVFAQDGPPTVVINEIHAKPEPATEFVEFIELTNPVPWTVDLSDWMLDGGVRYFFPRGTVLLPGHYLVIAQDRAAFATKYGFQPHGEFDGKLGNDGETVVLRNWQADPVDEVDYGSSFPWPIVGPPPGNSLQLINPHLDNARPGAWRAALPTPGAPNRVLAENAPPLIDAVTHSPIAPTSRDDVVITVQVTDDDGVAGVTLFYQDVAPGAYIRRGDPEYGTRWTPLTMTQEEEGRWQVTMPAALRQHRHLVRYRIQAVDTRGNALTVPYADDPQPNFAYFVYDGVPAWQGSNSGGPDGVTTYDFGAMRPMAVYHFIAQEMDVADALFLPPSGRAEGYFGSDYLWTGTLVYDGVVYDHVGFRARGAWARFLTGKTWWKINFLAGHRFQAKDDYGRPYAVKWDKLNLNGIMQHTTRKSRGEQGMYESTGFRLFNLAGMEASHTQFVHLRVIDNATEGGRSQYDTDFWGMYLAVENVDGRFLAEHDLPDGNLYKSKGMGDLEKENQGPTASPSFSDINAFLNTVKQSTPSDDWWRANFDLARYYRYRAIVDMIRHYDITRDKNVNFLLNPETNQWIIIPWDLDLTWVGDHAGIVQDTVWVQLWGRSFFRIAYQNHVRELQDLLFNPEAIGLVLDETAAFIDTPRDGLAMVDADRALWDGNPVFDTRYVDPVRTRKGEYYRLAPDRTFRGMVDLMRTFVAERTAWTYTTLISDDFLPDTPTVSYQGPAGFPADQLHFTSSPYASTRGGHRFAAMSWRIAEVTNPSGPVYDPAAPVHHEIEALYGSGDVPEFLAEWRLPPGIAQPGHTYRVRVRMQDDTGRWSRWSAPIQFVAGAPLAGSPSLVISEIHYHPPHVGPQDGDNFEFIELLNHGALPVNLTNVRVAGGIDYRFDAGVVLAAGARLVLAGDRRAFEEYFGMQAHGQYAGRLANGGDELQLLDGFGRLIMQVAYGDDQAWPAAADGQGHSLVLVDVQADPGDPANWQASLALGGSPGQEDPAPVVINELQLTPLRLELYNPATRPADVGGWYVSDDPRVLRKARLPDGAIVPAGGYLVLTADDLTMVDDRAFDPVQRGTLVLAAAATTGRLIGYQQSVAFRGAEAGASVGRVVTSDGRDHFVPLVAPTLGLANTGPRIGPVIIDALRYRSGVTGEALRLTNVGTTPVDLFDTGQPAQTWRLDGLFYALPPGLTLAPGDSLLVTAASPVESCLRGAIGGAARVVGPLPLHLLDSGQTVQLVQPRATGMAEVDRVSYRAAAPWPHTPDGDLLRSAGGFGAEPADWTGASWLETGSSSPAVARAAWLCAVEMVATADGGRVLRWAAQTDSSVTGFRLWRAAVPDRTVATLSAEGALPAPVAGAELQLYSVEATSPASTYYWLDALTVAGTTIELGMTRPAAPYYAVYLPAVR